MYKIREILASNVFANIFSMLAFLLALMIFIQNYKQESYRSLNTIVLTRDSSFTEKVYLTKNNKKYSVSIPMRLVITNRSERTHPLQELFFTTGEERQFIKEVFNKNKEKIILPINLSSNESKVLFFYINLSITLDQGEYLLSQIDKNSKGEAKDKWEITILSKLFEFFIETKNKKIGMELLKLPKQGKLNFIFATTKDGRQFEINREIHVP